MRDNKRIKLTGAAILVSRGMRDLQAAPAAYPFRSGGEVGNRMSLRPEISGFSLQALEDLLACKDEGVLASLVEEFDAKVKFRDNPTRTAEAHAILRRAIHEAPRWADLEVEREVHVWAAIVLAFHGQTHLGTDSNHWKMPAVWDFIEQYHPQIPEEGRKYLSVFTRGRGLFARRIETSWSFYGFLDHQQLQALLGALTEFQAGDPARRGQGFLFGFVDELVGWLTRIEAASKDLWFYCY